jgi:hypothetical protein
VLSPQLVALDLNRRMRSNTVASLVAALRAEDATSDTLTSADIDAYTPAGTSDDEARALIDDVRTPLLEAETHEQRSG